MKNKKGFTLIELLAVIIILGILMIIAIPSVTSYISNSRKSAYVDTAKEIVSGTRNIVNEGKLEMYSTDTTYYIPSNYIKTENASKSPYGEFVYAYTAVIYDGKGYKYYWISVDDARQGVKRIIPIDKLNEDDIESDINPDDIKNTIQTTGIGDKHYIKILKPNGTWETEIYLDNTNGNISEEGTYPSVDPPISFSTDSWSTIVEAVKSGNTSVYNVGDTKEINIEGFGQHTIRIANKSNPSECSNSGYSQTACGFVIEFTDIVFLNKMKSPPVGQAYSNYNYGGWPISELRNVLNNQFYEGLPTDLKAIIKDTYVVSGHGKNDTNNFTTTDKIYILTPTEVFGEFISGGSCYYWMEYEGLVGFTRQLDYYNSIGLSCNNYNYNGAIKKYNGNPYYYWQRSAPYNSYDYFMYISNYGKIDTSDTFNAAGISPLFRIG